MFGASFDTAFIIARLRRASVGGEGSFNRSVVSTRNKGEQAATFREQKPDPTIGGARDCLVQPTVEIIGKLSGAKVIL